MAEDQDAPLQDDEEEQQSQMPSALAAAILGGGSDLQQGTAPAAPSDDPDLASEVAPPAAHQAAGIAQPKSGSQSVASAAARQAAAMGSTEDLENRADSRFSAPQAPPQGSTEDLEDRADDTRNAAPSPSDDPDIAVPNAPDLSNSPLAKLLGDYNDTQQKLNAVPKPDPTKLRPRLWERLVGAVAGTAAGMRGDTALAAKTSAGVTGRRLAQAESDYDIQTSPLKQQLEADREGLGLAEAQSKIPQQSFENQLSVAREKREQNTSSGRMAQYRARAEQLEGQSDKFIAGTEQEDDKSPTGWTAQTFGGDRKPFSPKSDTAATKTPTNDFAAWQEAFQRDNNRPPTAKEITNHQVSLKQAERAPKDESPNGWTPSESREISSRGRRYQTRIDSLEKQRGDFIGSNRPEDKQTLAAIDNEIEQNHQQIDGIENEVLGRRKPAAGAGTARPTATNPAATATPAQPQSAPAKPAAQPSTAPDPALWKDKTKVLVTRNQATGNVQRWQLQNGKAVLLSEAKK